MEHQAHSRHIQVDGKSGKGRRILQESRSYGPRRLVGMPQHRALPAGARTCGRGTQILLQGRLYGHSRRPKNVAAHRLVPLLAKEF